MRNHSSSFAAILRIGTPLLLVLVALTSPAGIAQCAGDEEDGANGCPAAQQGQPAAAGLPVSDTGRQQLPGADQSSEASAQNSLTNSANYTEAPARSRARANQPNNQQLPPEPLTEFQQFVAASTGELLPIYGANLFTRPNAAFGPLDHAPAPENLIVGPDDELRIRIWGQVNFSANLRVSREGEIYLPKAGAVHVGGLPVSELPGHLRAALERVYRNFDLSVDLGEIHSIQVYLTGRARQPGEYAVSGLSTLVDAVFLSGGPSAAGSMRHVLLRRQGKTITDFDLYGLLINGDKSGDVQLQSGDVLYIPAAGPEVALLGSVRESAIYELRGEETVAQLLDEAGGRTALADGARLLIERIDGAATRRAMSVTADTAGLATTLAAGDIVRVDAILSSYRETVTLRGSLANPGHFRWHTGMKLSELMPDRDALVSRDYWWRRTQLGLPAPEFTPSIETLPARSARDHSPAMLTRAQLQPGDQARSSEAEADSSRSASNSAERAFATQSPMQQGSGQAASIAGTDSHSRIEGQATQLRPGTQTDWNYAVIERVDPATMTPSLLPFDLGKLVLEHDPAQDLELQPGDVVTVFSQDDIHLPVERQTKYVRLEGEFAHAGVYSVQPGETLRALVARAGGLTSKAYLYGSEFTRKSTQELEQQRLKEYADQLEHQLQRNSIAFTGESGGGAQPGQVQAIDDALVVRLRQVVASGRVVLNLRPRSQGANALPDLPLEDGDRLVIPSTPATIQVIGAVLNQHAFLYRPEAHVADYMRLAGGPNRDADRGAIFILRADGSVTSHNPHQQFLANEFDRLHLNPGDTLVVPEKSLRPSALHEISAWAQLVSGFALSSAAISALK